MLRIFKYLDGLNIIKKFSKFNNAEIINYFETKSSTRVRGQLGHVGLS
jgi:hypothetical protein